jgi:hypothetical protein
VSAAKPMGHMKRAQAYARQRFPEGGLGFMWPGQRRRYRHKLRRTLGTFLAGDGVYPGDQGHAKGKPTPRQQRAAS